MTEGRWPVLSGAGTLQAGRAGNSEKVGTAARENWRGVENQRCLPGVGFCGLKQRGRENSRNRRDDEMAFE